jgi:hypothetical protein
LSSSSGYPDGRLADIMKIAHFFPPVALVAAVYFALCLLRILRHNRLVAGFYYLRRWLRHCCLHFGA